MLNLLVVDDEEITREGIFHKIPWKDLLIGEVRQVDDGITALAIAENFHPDIVLTDVKMSLHERGGDSVSVGPA